jgi:hypothetical protein
MSLGMAIAGPEGLVLAAESRVTLTAQAAGQPPLHVNYDNATKLLSFSPPNTHLGAVTYGLGSIGFRTAASFLPEFEAGLIAPAAATGKGRPKAAPATPAKLPVGEFSQRLSDFFMEQWRLGMPAKYAGPDMIFVIGGYDDGEPYGTVLEFYIPSRPTPVVKQAAGQFGMVWGGQRETVDRIVQGYDSGLPAIVQKELGLTDPQRDQMVQAIGRLQMSLPLQAMALQDCVDLAIFFIRTTIAAQRLTVTVRGVGGPIDVATVTRQSGLQFVQRKSVVGEDQMVERHG